MKRPTLKYQKYGDDLPRPGEIVLAEATTNLLPVGFKQSKNGNLCGPVAKIDAYERREYPPHGLQFVRWFMDDDT